MIQFDAGFKDVCVGIAPFIPEILEFFPACRNQFFQVLILLLLLQLTYILIVVMGIIIFQTQSMHYYIIKSA